jgi:hypothetical protein
VPGRKKALQVLKGFFASDAGATVQVMWVGVGVRLGTGVGVVASAVWVSSAITVCMTWASATVGVGLGVGVQPKMMAPFCRGRFRVLRAHFDAAFTRPAHSGHIFYGQRNSVDLNQVGPRDGARTPNRRRVP